MSSQHDDFAARWDTALEEACDRLEQEAWRRGMGGIDEPVFFQGQVCGYVRRYSDTLLGLLLRAHRPEKYRERVEHTGPEGKPIQFQDIEATREKRWQKVAPMLANVVGSRVLTVEGSTDA